ncbi:MAG: hypothetical protein JWM99_2555 [Verrucomicrobiales bacterium]|nr:hypothetical protein [Verrucomicrobiales bacterium]
MVKRLANHQWNYETAAHLLNRAGFGGTPREIQKLAALGLDGAVDSLVDYEKIPDTIRNPSWAKPDPERLARFQKIKNAPEQDRQELRKQEQRLQREHLVELRQWWLVQMLETPRPLQEKLTLFWHGHFATSVQKVKDAYLMWRQNDVFRRNASGSWLTLLTEVSKDPAMLIWLDQAQSRKEHPNENFAREVMELFALGEGHYTEKDITEAARALTGWSYDRANQEFISRPRMHDTGTKTVLGKMGRFDGDEILKIIVEQPQSSRFVAEKLWTFFGGENPSDAWMDTLASDFCGNGGNFKPYLKTIFTSEEFYSESVVRRQIKSPVQWLISSSKLLERELPPPQISATALRLLGQELFAPPNVKGWDGGLSWITTNNLLNRYNFAAYLVLGENPLAHMAARRGNKGMRRTRQIPEGHAIDPTKIVPLDERKDTSTVVNVLGKRFLQASLRGKQSQTLVEYIESQAPLDDLDILHATRLIMSTPEFQLT